MTNLKLFLVRVLDWIDVEIFDHRFCKVCYIIGTTSWWNSPPIEEDGLIKYDAESNTLNIRLSNRKIEISQYIEPGIIVDYDFDRNVVRLEILDISEYIEKERLLSDLREGIHAAMTGDTIPASDLRKALDELDDN